MIQSFDLRISMRKKRLRNIFASAATAALLVSFPGAASAEPTVDKALKIAQDEQVVQELEGMPELPKAPEERRALLVDAGFVKSDERSEHGYTVETYRLEDANGVVIEYDVILPPEPGTIVPFINFEWDWGPRVYMTGAEFWSLGASGFAGALCSVFAGPWWGAGCSMAATAAWNKIAGNNRILSDQTCYDLSQALNIGWERAPQEKCS